VATVVRLGRRKNLVQRKNDRIDLTPTGLLMEGDYTQNPVQNTDQPVTLMIENPTAPMRTVVPKHRNVAIAKRAIVREMGAASA
jgi:hypothetical protein